MRAVNPTGSIAILIVLLAHLVNPLVCSIFISIEGGWLKVKKCSFRRSF